MGLKRTMPRTVHSGTKTPIKTTSPKSKGPVTRRVAKVGHTPIVTKPPRGSKERKVVEQTADVPYWEKVKRQFFR